MIEDAPDTAALLDACLALFRERFGGAPEAAASAPGRVNLIGDHTDYNEGFVLPMAIDRRTVVCLRRSGSAATRVVSSFAPDAPAELSTGGDAPPTGGWARYVQGSAALMARRTGERIDLEIAVASDVPVGGGLSSSAAIEVATCAAIESLLRLELDPVERARLCRAAEHEYAGVPCGIMDQLICSAAVPEHALLIDCRSLEREPVPLDPGMVRVLIVDSTLRHDLADGSYAERRRACDEAARRLAETDPSVRSLRDASLELIDRADLPESLARCARHVVTENDRGVRTADLLRRGEVVGAGATFHESHVSLSRDFRVSRPEIDDLVRIAASTEGVHGARMTGGGFGGCVVALVRPDRAHDAARTIVDNYRAEHALEARVLSTTAASGVGRIGV